MRGACSRHAPRAVRCRTGFRPVPTRSVATGVRPSEPPDLFRWDRYPDQTGSELRTRLGSSGVWRFATPVPATRVDVTSHRRSIGPARRLGSHAPLADGTRSVPATLHSPV